MRASVDGVDIICEAENTFRIAVVVLQRHFHAQQTAVRHLALALDVNGLLVQHRFALIQVPDKLRYSAAVVKFVLFRRLRAFVGECYGQALVQERQLAQPLRQSVEIELGGIHDGAVRLECDLGAGLLSGLTGLFKRTLRNALLVILFPGKCFVPDLKVQRF